MQQNSLNGTTDAATAGLPDYAQRSRDLVPVTLVRGCAGAVAACCWLLAAMLLAQKLVAGDPAALGPWVLRACVAAGLVVAFAAFAIVHFVAHRGPEFDPRAMIGLSLADALVLTAAGILPGIPVPVLAGAWVVAGACGAYALRRTLHVLRAYAAGRGGSGRAGELALKLAGITALAALAVWRMDAVGATVTTCMFLPLALWLLPQGWPVLGERAARPWPDAAASETADAGSAPSTMREAVSSQESVNQFGSMAPSFSGPSASRLLAEIAALVEHGSGGHTPDVVEVAAEDVQGPSEGEAMAAAGPEAPRAAQPVQATMRERREAHFNDVAVRYGLSEREHDLLFLLADGVNAQQIAERAYVSRNTAKTHMAHIYAKLGIHSRAELDEILAVDGER